MPYQIGHFISPREQVSAGERGIRIASLYISTAATVPYNYQKWDENNMEELNDAVMALDLTAMTEEDARLKAIELTETYIEFAPQHQKHKKSNV